MFYGRLHILRGFTAIEILISIAIIIILTSIMGYSFSTFRNNQQLRGEIETIRTLLDEAQTRTLSSKDDSSYGVHIENDKVVLFRGITYSALDPENEITTLHPDIEIVNISLNGGGPNVVFERLTGDVDAYGSLTVRVKSDTAINKIISISKVGVVGEN